LVGFFGLTISLLAFGANLYRQNSDLSRLYAENKHELNKQMSKSRSYRTISTSFHVLSNRVLRLPSSLTLKGGQTLLVRRRVPVLAGVVIFGVSEPFFLRVNLWQGAREFWGLRGTLWWCGFGMCLANLVGSWSVGEAFLHVLALSWGWLRLYRAGGQ